MRREDWSQALRADRAAAPHVTVGRIAAHMNKSDSLVYKMLEGEHAPSITQLIDFADLTGGHNIMRWLGSMTNHHVAPIPVGRMDDIQYADLLREFSEAVTAYTLATADGDVTQAEATEVGAQLEDVIVAAQRLKMGIERRVKIAVMRPATMTEGEAKTGGAA